MPSAIKKIPDGNIKSSCRRFLVILKDLTDTDKNTLIRLALKYPPATKALLGALFDELKQNQITDSLYKSLNPITKYKLPGVSTVLKAIEKWNINDTTRK